jgi:hypothetical protein
MNSPDATSPSRAARGSKADPASGRRKCNGTPRALGRGEKIEVSLALLHTMKVSLVRVGTPSDPRIGMIMCQMKPTAAIASNKKPIT